MRWKLCYTFMMLSLVAVLAYSGYSATRGPKAFLPGLDDGINDVAAIETPLVREAGNIAVSEPSVRQVHAGASRDEVIAVFGQPDAIDQSNNRWTYDSQVILFRDDHVLGCIKVDRTKTARAAEDELADTLREAKTATGKTMRMPKSYYALHSKIKRYPKRYTAAPQRQSRVLNSRYQMNPFFGNFSSGPGFLWEPMYRPFYSDRPLARSATASMGGRYPNRYSRGGYPYQSATSGRVFIRQ